MELLQKIILLLPLLLLVVDPVRSKNRVHTQSKDIKNIQINWKPYEEDMLSYPDDQIIDPNYPGGRYEGCTCQESSVVVEEIEYDTELLCFPQKYEESCNSPVQTTDGCNETMKQACDILAHNTTISITIQECVVSPSKRCNLRGAEVCETSVKRVCKEVPDFEDFEEDDLNCKFQTKNNCNGAKDCNNLVTKRCSVKPGRKISRGVNIKCEEVPTTVCGPSRCPVVMGRQQCKFNQTIQNGVTNSTNCKLQPTTKCWSVGVPKNVFIDNEENSQNCKIQKTNPRLTTNIITKYTCTCKDAEWSEWVEDDCCVDGFKLKRRTCSSSISSSCVKTCEGYDVELIPCTSGAEWGSWLEWSECSKTCGVGEQTRSRDCIVPDNQCNYSCEGDNTDYLICSEDPGCDCSDWTVGECSVDFEDEVGIATSTRNCIKGASPSFQCEDCPETAPIPCKGKKATDLQWHMIIGGSNGTMITDSVELFNYKTSERCLMTARLPIPLSEHSGAVLNDVPIVCGGYSIDNMRQSACYKFNVVSNKWYQAPDADVVFNRAGSAVVTANESKGWHIFGGYKEFNKDFPGYKPNHPPQNFDYKESILLKQSTDEWETGIKLINYTSISGQCVVQLNNTMTVFFGGDENPREIVMLNWESDPVFSTSATPLHEPRVHSSCAVVNNKNGNTLVAIVGGGSPNIELWNPEDQSIINILKVPISSEISAPHPRLDYAQLLSVKNGNELLLYGGNMKSERQDIIFSYSFLSDQWSEKCKMLTPRGEHVVLPVSGINCTSYGESTDYTCTAKNFPNFK